MILLVKGRPLGSEGVNIHNWLKHWCPVSKIYAVSLQTTWLGISWSMVSMLWNDHVVIGRTCPQSMPLDMLTMKKELHGFLFTCMWSCSYSYGGPRIWAAEAPLQFGIFLLFTVKPLLSGPLLKCLWNEIFAYFFILNYWSLWSSDS